MFAPRLPCGDQCPLKVQRHFAVIYNIWSAFSLTYLHLMLNQLEKLEAAKAA